MSSPALLETEIPTPLDVTGKNNVDVSWRRWWLLLPFLYIDVHGGVVNWSLGQIFRTSIQISRIFFLFLVLGFQKRIASIFLKKLHMGYMFLKAQMKKNKKIKH